MNLDDKRKYLVSQLQKEGRIVSNKVMQAFLNTPREAFLPKQLTAK